MASLRRLWQSSQAPYYKPSHLALLFGYTKARAYNKATPMPDLAALDTAWAAQVNRRTLTEQRATTIGLAYETAISRAMRVEAKAIGLLQVIAIGFAVVALVTDEDHPLLVVLALVAVAYLGLATVGATELLRTEAQHQVVVEHAKDRTAGLKETAVATASLEARSPRASNLLTGVLRDLRVGLGAAAAALVLSILGVG